QGAGGGGSRAHGEVIGRGGRGRERNRLVSRRREYRRGRRFRAGVLEKGGKSVVRSLRESTTLNPQLQEVFQRRLPPLHLLLLLRVGRLVVSGAQRGVGAVQPQPGHHRVGRREGHVLRRHRQAVAQAAAGAQGAVALRLLGRLLLDDLHRLPLDLLLQ